jgi:hypothetical protein
MAVANKFNDFVRQLCNKEHDLDTDAITLALTNTLPVAANDYVNDITEIVYTGVSGSRALANKVLSQAAGIAKFVADDVVLTGTGAGFGPFRYLVLFNDTPGTAATKGLICWIDYGSSISVAAGEIFTTDFDQTNGILTLGP